MLSTAASADDSFTYVPLVPTVASVTPNSGATIGGTPVTIIGTDFYTGATVMFDGKAATNVVVLSPTQITATSPAGAAGTVKVTVTSLGGTSTP